MDVDTNMNVSWEEPSLNTGLLASVPAALWIKDAMRSHWEIRPRLCGFLWFYDRFLCIFALGKLAIVRSFSVPSRSDRVFLRPCRLISVCS